MSIASETPILSIQEHSRSASARTSSDSAYTRLRPTTPSSVHSSSSELGDNDIIPPYHPAAPRTLVLCFDGTGDQFDLDNSNVVKFFSLLKRDDKREQMVYYQTGIGTYTNPQLVTSIGQAVSKTLDEMVAWNLDAHVTAGYEFLMQNYEAGDKICLFGFSRGAYTARALAGMLHKVGLLPSHNHQQIPFAYRMYTRTDALGWQQSNAFKKAFSIDVDIDFIGVWDTVCSVGVIPHRLPFTTSNTAIRTFRHALSLDERRAKFKANQYNRPNEWEKTLGTHLHDMPRPVARSMKGAHRRTKSQSPSAQHRDGHVRSASAATAMTVVGAVNSNGTAAFAAAVQKKMEKDADAAVEVVEEAAEAAGEAAEAAMKAVTQTRSKLWGHFANQFDTMRTLMRKKGKRLTEEEQDFNKADIIKEETDVKEVWFAGCHSDVGGGSVADSEKHSLARIPLRWMIRECFRTNTGIRFHAELLKEIGLDPASLRAPPAFPPPSGPGPVLTPQLQPPPLDMRANCASWFPRIAFDPPTPLERPRADVDARMQVNVSANVAGGEEATATPMPAAMHRRQVSVSTTGTLVGTIAPAPKGLYADAKHREDDGEDEEVRVNEQAEERRDALCPVYDQLALKPWWWLLEFLPIEQRKQLPNNKWKKYMSINFGRGRTVTAETGPFYVHKSVKVRMDAGEHLPGGPYRPKALYHGLEMIWVD